MIQYKIIYSINMHTTVHQFWWFVYHHEVWTVRNRSLCTNIIIYAIILYEDQIARISFIMAPVPKVYVQLIAAFTDICASTAWTDLEPILPLKLLENIYYWLMTHVIHKFYWTKIYNLRKNNCTVRMVRTLMTVLSVLIPRAGACKGFFQYVWR